MRYAIYWTPSLDHPLWAAGCRWLGRNPDDEGRPANDPPPRRTEPWRYGLHATLVAPFYLAPGCSDADLSAAVKALAERHEGFDMPQLEVATLADFIALRPADEVGPDHALRELADDAVRTLSDIRMPPTPEELERQRLRLQAEPYERYRRWGSPHVFDHWRFHMTLSDSFRPDEGQERDDFLVQAQEHFELALSEPLRADTLSVFVEMEAGVPFTRYGVVPLGQLALRPPPSRVKGSSRSRAGSAARG